MQISVIIGWILCLIIIVTGTLSKEAFTINNHPVNPFARFLIMIIIGIPLSGALLSIFGYIGMLMVAPVLYLFGWNWFFALPPLPLSLIIYICFCVICTITGNLNFIGRYIKKKHPARFVVMIFATPVFGALLSVTGLLGVLILTPMLHYFNWGWFLTIPF